MSSADHKANGSSQLLGQSASEHTDDEAALASLVRLMARHAAQAFLKAAPPPPDHSSSKDGGK